jgi:hypothetical protein
VRGAALSLIAATSIAFQPPAALAASCQPQSAEELRRFGDIAATGVVDRLIPLGFILRVDRIYAGNDLPAHVLVISQYDVGSAGTRHYVVMRQHVPGVYSMGACNGRPMSPEMQLGPLGEGRPPTGNLSVAQAAAIAGALLVLVLIRRRRGAGSPPAATATAY